MSAQAIADAIGASDLPQKALAERYGVSKPNISASRRGISWRYVS